MYKVAFFNSYKVACIAVQAALITIYKNLCFRLSLSSNVTQYLTKVVGIFMMLALKLQFGNFMSLYTSILCQVTLHLCRCSSMKSNAAMSTYTSNNIGCCLKYKLTYFQKHKNTKTQKYKNTKTQKYKNTKTQKLYNLIFSQVVSWLTYIS